MSNLAVEEAQAVVYVSNRGGAALRRRERCLKLAGIPHGVEAERRPSGTYYKLCVRENDAVAAHLALQMGGCGRTVKLQDPRPSFFDTLREIARAALEELTLLLTKLVDAIRGIAPLLLAPPKDSTGSSTGQ